ncbi:DUF3203 family protein [Pseudomonas oligotrophica]|uniref:DUF3203 family protein n=1 Tax=Pseudomonas oligotrophica TaxID=2912055 RepID=UPI001F249979|nr:DUF3203 family protein [Pseudomonas oligotrophica]MCF7203300.1 DUF3203 family protein [Pseudomonas oligotrophica]
MAVEIDTTTGTCVITVNGQPHRGAIGDARITTDPQARMSELHLDGHRLHLPEDEAEHLIAAGATDDRSNLIADD